MHIQSVNSPLDTITIVQLMMLYLPQPSQANQAKVLTGGGDLREAQVDVPLSVSHSSL